MSDALDGTRNKRTTIRLHRIFYGRVHCPYRGLTDVDLCFYCPLLRHVDLDRPAPRIGCVHPFTLSERDARAWVRWGALQLAQSTGNVSRTCRKLGIARRQFYRFRKRYEAEGWEGLRR